MLENLTKENKKFVEEKNEMDEEMKQIRSKFEEKLYYFSQKKEEMKEKL